MVDERVSAGEAGEGREREDRAIDVVLLARKVYELMRDELRLERARGAAIVRPR
jgi:hypothetical protein